MKRNLNSMVVAGLATFALAGSLGGLFAGQTTLKLVQPSAPAARGTNLTFRLQLQSGSNSVIYVLQTSTNLMTWQTVFSGKSKPGSAVQISDVAPTNQTRFFRVREYGPLLVDTNPPTWTNGANGQLAITPPASVALSWDSAIDDIGVAEYRLYVNGVLVTNVTGATLTYQFTINLHRPTDIRIQAVDASGNASDIFALAYLPGDDILAVYDIQGRLYTFYQQTNGAFSAPKQIFSGNTAQGGVTLADFNRDGILDIVAGGASGNTLTPSFFKGKGDGTFAPPAPLSTAQGANSYMMGATMGDFDGDGNLDFVCDGNERYVFFYWGNGDGTFTLEIKDWGCCGRGLVGGDFDEDGREDLARGTYSDGRVRLFLSNGDRTFTETNQVGQFGNDPYGLVAGDFNEDGHLDILQNSSSAGDVVFYKGAGNGTFTPLGTNGPWANLKLNDYAAMSAFDYSGDGHLDIVLSTYSGHSVYLFPGNGDGTFSTNSVTVTTSVGNALGISAPLRAPRVDVNIIPVDPVANLNGTITYKGVGAGVSASDVFKWSFGDQGTNPLAWTFGTNTPNMGQTISHQYTNEGRFLARLWHTDARGIQSVRGTWATIKANPPVANPGGPYAFGSEVATQAVWYATLDGSASTDDFGIVAYTWDFGDGTGATSGSPTISHGWTNSGVWTVSLTVTDAARQTNTKSTKVTFTPGAPPIAVIDGLAVVDETHAQRGVWSATFYSTNSSDAYGIWKYAWNFGNGQSSTSPTGSATYSSVGTNVVTLTVTGNDNQTNSTNFTVVIKANGLPVPIINGPHVLPVGVSTNGLWFGAWDALASTDDTGIYQYNWSFGDGASGSGSQITHNYAAQGVYPLKLTVTDNGNQSVSATQNVVVVGGSPPVARITASTLSPEGSQPVTLSGATSTSDNGIYLYTWFLPPRQFNFAGQYLDPNQWLSASTTQNGKLLVTGQGSWEATYFFSIGTLLQRGGSFQGRIDTPSTTPSGSHAVVGLKNLNTASGHEIQYPYALYFLNGDLHVYANGGDLGKATNYLTGTSYDFRIETKPNAGARFYLRASGTGDPFTQIFETANGTDSYFSFGADVLVGVFGFENFAVDGVVAFGRDQIKAISPGGTVTLQVVDSALMTNSTSVVITPVVGTPPSVVINGPTNGQSGVELSYTGYGSSDDHGIASYTWDFGDGSTVAFGPAVSHSYGSAGTYTNTLTVMDFADQSASASLVVTITGSNALVHVPWLIINGIEQPHEVYTGKTNTLKAVARGVSAPFVNIWDFGDGTGSVTNFITNSAIVYNLEATHAYNAGVGTPFYAVATVILTNGTVLSDTYPLVVQAKTLEVEEKVAIDEGLWYLQKTQNRYDIDANTKAGRWDSGGTISATASSVQAFGVNGHLLTDDPGRDPYVDTIRRGLNYLLTQLITINIGPQPYGDPDGNHNGIALQAASGSPIYETGPVMDALVAVGRPELVALAGGPNVKGRAFVDIVQDLVDMFCWGQYDDPVVGGGWRYGWNQGPDNSASQWGAIGMFPAERFWGITIPDWVKARNLVWVNYSAGAGGFGYTGPGDGIATTPSALVQLGFDDIPTTNSLWIHGENYLANNWSSAQNFMSQNNVYANYAIAKGLRTANPQPVHNLALTGKDWFLDPVDGLARVTINRQSPAGAWTSSQWVDQPLATAWSILILSSSLFQQGPVAVINVSPNPSAIGYPVVFDARSSYHKHPGYKIVEYRWVFDPSKGADFDHPDAVGPVVTNVFGSLSTNTVSLQVRDNSTPQLFDTASVVVQTTIPPYPPTADAGGPYVALAGQDIHLDASGSFTVDAASGNFIQSFDWEINYQVPVTFNQGVRGPKPVITNGYPTAGAYQIGVRVKNANSLVYTNFALPDLTADAFTTVYVYNRVIPDLRVRTKATKAQLTWTKVGDYAVIVRSQVSADRGFVEVGRTDSSYATFLDTTIDYNNEYYYRVYAYANGSPNAIGLSDPVFVVSPPRNLDQHAPKFQSTPARFAKVGQLYEVTLDAKDPENKPFYFSLLSGPTNLTLNPTTGLVDFTPTPAQLGNQFVSFQVSNSIGRDVLSFTLFIFPATNNPPVVNVNGPYAALIGQPIQFSSAGTSDPDNNPLRLYWNFGDGSTSTNANPVHTYGGVGDYLISLFANDGYGGTVSAQTHAQITRPNVPPIAVVNQGPNFTVRLGETLTLDGSGSRSPIGNPLTYTWVWGDGTGATNAANVASHVYPAGGPYAGSLIVADNRGGQDAYNFQVTMAPATLPPVIALSVSNNPAFVMDTVTFDASGTVDPQGDPMNFRWDFGDHSRTTGPLVTHVFQQITNFTVTLVVSNSHGAVSTSTQLVQVVDAPPIFVSQPPLMVRAGKVYTYAPVVTDLANAGVTFQLVQGPTTMSLDTNTGVLSWLPGTNNIGPNAVDLLATDAYGGATHQTFTVVVTTPLGPQLDLAPTHIEMSNVVVDAQSLALSGTVTVYLRNNGTDPVPVPFTVSVFVDKDLDGAFSTNSDLVVGYGVAPKDFPAGGSASIEMTVFGQTLFKDCPLYAYVDSQNVVTEFNELNNLQRSGFDANTNQPPVIDLSAASLAVNRSTLPASAVLTARLGNSGLVTVPTNVAMAFYDGDPNAGGLLIGVAHSTSALNPGTYQDLSVTWNAPSVTNHTVFVVADDPGTGVFALAEIGYANNTFSVEEDLAAILPPIADAGSDGSVYLGDTVSLNGSGSKDPQSRPLTYRWSFFSIPIGSQARLSSSTGISPSFKTDLAGQYAVQLVVNNGILDSTNAATVTITGVDTNVYSPPTISSAPSFQAIVGVPYRYQVQAKDSQNGSLTYRLPQAPPGMTIGTNSGLVQWTPTNSGSFLVQVAVDGRGGSYYQGYTLTVIPFTNLPPQFASTPITTTAPTSNYTYTAAANSPVGNTVTYSLTQSPSGMSINGQSGVVSWIPTVNQVGGNIVTITANDGHGGTATQTYTLVVLTGGLGGPQVAAIPDQTITAPAAFATIALDNYVIDPNYPANQITWKVSGTNLLTVVIDSNRVATVTYPGGVNAAEQITFLATDPSGLSGFSSPLLTVLGNAAPPVAAIANLDPNATTSIDTGFFELKGTADDPGVPVPVAWRISLYDNNGARVADLTPPPVNSAGWHEGRVQAGGSFGTLDFTLVRSDAYTLGLEVQAGSQTANATARINLDSKLKIGQLRFSQQDLVLPVQGVGLQVNRFYDSLNPATADFGYSWTYGTADLGLSVDDNRVDVQDETDEEFFSLRTGGSWDVTLTMPDTGRRVTFRFSLNQGSFTAQAVWTPPPGVQASLVPTISPTLVTLPGLPPIWQAGGIETDWQAFDWPGFILTTANGVQYRIDRQDLGEHFYATDGSYGGFVHSYTGGYLSRITLKTGDHTDFVRNGTALQNIVQFNPGNQRLKSILFQRDSQQRIQAVYTPENLDSNGIPVGPATVKYGYDTTGNLVTVGKLTDASDPSHPLYATTTYVYANLRVPHLLTEIKDPRGISILRAEFDAAGRLVGTVDASGHRTAITHDLAARTETAFDRMGNSTQLAYDEKGNIIALTDALGHTTRFTHDADNRTTSTTDPLGNTTSIGYDAGGNVSTVTDPLGHTVTGSSDSSGRFTSATDALGHITTAAYDTAGLLSELTNPFGQKTTYLRDAGGNVTSTIDPNGNPTGQYEYDSSGRPSTMTSPTGVRTVFTYDSQGNRSSMERQWVNPDDTNDVKLLSARSFYDAAGNPTNTVGPTGLQTTATYNDFGRPVQEIDARGNVNTSIYDIRGNLIETFNPDGTLSQTVYDDNDRAILRVGPFVPGQMAYGMATTYDPVGRQIGSLLMSNVVVVVDTATNNGIATAASRFVSSGGVISSNLTVYDDAGRVVAKIGPQGGAIRYEYDANGNRTAEIDPLGSRVEYTYDAAGRQTSVKDPTGSTVTYLYDVLGHLTRIVYPDGASALTVYDEQHNRRSRIDELGNARDFEFGEVGRLTATILPAVPDPEANNALVRPRFQYSYDAYGNLRTIQDAKGRQTQFAFDEFNHLVGRRLPGGQTSSQAFDSFGQLVRATDFDGQAMQVLYDSYGRPTQNKFFASGTNVPGEVVTYAYDSAGRQSRITDPRGATVFDYDTKGNLTALTMPEGTIHYETDDLTGQKTRTWTANSDTHYSYDLDGRLAAVRVVKRNGQVLASPEVTSYTYDANGNRQSVTLPNGVSTTYQYDSRYRLTKLTHLDAASNILASYSYSVAANGQRTSATEIKRQPGGPSFSTNIFTYAYDSLGRLTGETNLFSQTNRLGFATQYTYDIVGNRLMRQVTVGSKTVTTTYVYDENDRLRIESNSVNSASSPFPGTAGLKVSPPGVGTGEARYLKYRAQAAAVCYYFLKSAPWVILAAFLLPAGFVFRRLRKIRVLTVDLCPTRALFPRCISGFLAAVLAFMSFDGRVLADEAALYAALTTDTWGLDGSVSVYTYDANGAVIGKSTTGPKPETIVYAYNLHRQLALVSRTTSNAGQVLLDSTRYGYDQAGNRVRSESQVSVNGVPTSGSTNIFLIDPVNLTGVPQVLEELPAVGSPPSRSYTLADDVISQTTDEGGTPVTDFFLHDGHGSTRQLTDASASVSDSYAYDAFGVMVGDTSAADSAKTRLLFSGEYFDQGSRQYNLRARNYDPGIGRFSSMDPLPGMAEDPHSLHKYMYSANDPVNRVDPTGMQDLTSEMAVVAIQSILASIVVGWALFGVGVAANGDVPDAAMWGISASLSVSGNYIGRLTRLGRGLATAAPGLAFGKLFGDYGEDIADYLKFSLGPIMASYLTSVLLEQALAGLSGASAVSNAQFNYNVGLELLDTTEVKSKDPHLYAPQFSLWGYHGPGISIGSTSIPVSVSMTLYGGVVWGAPTWDSYAGPFVVVGGSFAPEEFIGVAGGYFFSPTNPLQNGIYSGVTFGPAVGGFSLAASVVRYTALAGPTPDLGISAKTALLGAWPLGVGVILYLSSFRNR